jgi:hypothetical protein
MAWGFRGRPYRVSFVRPFSALVVSEDVNYLMAAVLALETVGFQVVSARDRAKGIALIRKVCFDLVVLGWDLLGVEEGENYLRIVKGWTNGAVCASAVEAMPHPQKEEALRKAGLNCFMMYGGGHWDRQFSKAKKID